MCLRSSVITSPSGEGRPCRPVIMKDLGPCARGSSAAKQTHWEQHPARLLRVVPMAPRGERWGEREAHAPCCIVSDVLVSDLDTWFSAGVRGTEAAWLLSGRVG